jgi:transcriptional regulator with XRE-family HTH domain
MSEPTYSIGPLMKAARKFKKFNQADVAQAIGCSQSALSKMEHNLLVPSAPQWFMFSRFTSIPPETLETGFIDRHTKVKLNNDQVSLGFKIPKKYRHFRAEKVREVYPFLKYLEKNVNPPQHKDFVLSTGLDPEFFLDFDNLINLQLFLDAISYLMKIGHGNETHIQEVVKFQDDIYWNHYGVEWKNLKTIDEVLNEFVQVQVFFQTDFQLKVESHTGKTTITYFPEYHLKQIGSSIMPEQVGCLNRYRKATLENLIQRVMGSQVSVNLTPEVSTSPLGARFEIKSAA